MAGIGLRLVGEGGASLALPRVLGPTPGLEGLVARGEGGGMEREDDTRERPVLGVLECPRDGRADGCELGYGCALA